MFPVNIDFWIFHFRGYEGHWALATLIMGYFYQRHRSLKSGYSQEWFDQAWGISILSGFFFARFFHFAFWDQKAFLENPIIFFTATGGFAIFGGTIGTAFGAFVYCQITKKNFLHWCDSLMVPLTLGLCFSRLSCFLNGDAYGLPTSLPWGLVFSENSDAWMGEWYAIYPYYRDAENPLAILSQIFAPYVNLADIPIPEKVSHLRGLGFHNLADLSTLYPPVAGADFKTKLLELGLVPFPVVYPKVHPTQLYEVFLMFIVLFFMLRIEKYSWSQNLMFFFFWVFYGLVRFFIEIFRGDRHLFLGNLTYAQVIALTITVISGLILFVRLKNIKKQEPRIS